MIKAIGLQLAAEIFIFFSSDHLLSISTHKRKNKENMRKLNESQIPDLCPQTSNVLLPVLQFIPSQNIQ